MRYSLMSWPPVASHMACLLLGFAMPHLEVLDFRNDVLPLDFLYVTRHGPGKGDQPMLMVGADPQPCKWSAAVWRPYQVGPTFLVGASLKDLKGLPQAVSRLSSGDIKLAPKYRAEHYSFCNTQPLVTYEQR